MAGKFYIKSEDNELIYELSATTDIAISVPSKVSAYAIEDGSTVTDNIITKNETLSMSGIVTDVSQSSGLSPIGALIDVITQQEQGDSDIEEVEDYIRTLSLAISNKETFSVHFSDKLAYIPNCVITNFTYKKTNTLGGEAWLVSLSLKAIRIAKRAGRTGQPNDDFKTLVAAKEKAAQAPSDVDQSKVDKVEDTNRTNMESQGKAFGA